MPSPVPSFDIQPYLTQLGTAVAFVGAVVVAVLKLNRNASKTQTEIGEDKASQSILTVALRQRDEALKAAEVAWAQRNADAVAIATLMSEKGFWEAEKVRLLREFMEMESLCRRAARELRRVDPERAQLMFPSDWMEFNDTPER